MEKEKDKGIMRKLTDTDLVIKHFEKSFILYWYFIKVILNIDILPP